MQQRLFKLLSKCSDKINPEVLRRPMNGLFEIDLSIKYLFSSLQEFDFRMGRRSTDPASETIIISNNSATGNLIGCSLKEQVI